MNSADQFYVITGGPGSGKTSLIDALRTAGYAGSIEAGRAIIQDQTAIDGPALPDRDSMAFAALMLAWELHSYRLARQEPGPVFFDRGIPDLLGYYALLGRTVPDHVAKAVQTFRYNRRVFIAPPWPDIFEHDAERKQTWEESVSTHEAMVVAYSAAGYDLLTLPKASIEERQRFVIDAIKLPEAGSTRIGG